MKILILSFIFLISITSSADNAQIAIHLSKNLMSIQANYQTIEATKKRLRKALSLYDCKLMFLLHDLPENRKWSIGFQDHHANLTGFAECQGNGLSFTGTADIQSAPIDDNLELVLNIISDGTITTKIF